MKILGLSAFYHDSAAALVVDGRIVAAAQEERFSRLRHDPAFPESAIRYCLSEARLRLDDIDQVVFHESPQHKFARLWRTYLGLAPAGWMSYQRAMPLWLGEKLWQRRSLTRSLARLSPNGRFDTARLRFAQHHLSHAASAFYPSPFTEASVLVMDGVGELATTSLGHAGPEGIRLTQQLDFPHSLGLLYAAFTSYLGFRVNSGEYKVMGLAPYGQPRHADLILTTLVDLKPDGSFRLDQRYFDYAGGLRMTTPAFHDLFGGPPRAPESALTQREFDLAASLQAATEEIVLALAREAARHDRSGHLCLAGGVALNCVANSRLAREKLFERLWVQPAAGDAGAALGAALWAHHTAPGTPPRTPDAQDSLHGAALGPAFSDEESQRRLAALGAVFEVMPPHERLPRTVDALAAGRVVGWHQGRMEFGPRALGQRSILADPRAPGMQKTLNLKIKFRESFRPFAPVVRAEDAARFFEMPVPESPYMLFTGQIRDELALPLSAEQRALQGLELLNLPRSTLPAITHVDGSARVQTVHAQRHPLLHALLGAFGERTGCPVLVNTSFNVRGEPIVCTPEEAYTSFRHTGMDTLVVGHCLLHREAQTAPPPPQRQFEPD